MSENTTPELAEDEAVVYVVPLAKTLAIAESEQDHALTEEEVLKIRDTAPCAKIPKNKLQDFLAAQEFDDIDPFNAWFGWNKIKFEKFSAGPLPRLTFTIFAERDQVSKVRKLLQMANYEYQIMPPNQGLAADASNARSSFAPPMDSADQQKLSRHGAIFEVKSKPFDSSTATANAIEALKLISRLVDLGVLEIFSNSSYLAHANKIWKDLARDVSIEEVKTPRTVVLWQLLFFAFVQLPIRFEDEYISCGMHLLGIPDFKIRQSDARTIFGANLQEEEIVKETRKLMERLALYLLHTCTDGSFRSGNTFSLTDDAPSLRAVWQQCDVFPQGDPRFTYLGYYRFDLE